jgi:hypothetical protein
VLRDDNTGELVGLRRVSANSGAAFNAMPVYDLKSTSAANVFISSGGWMYFTTSAAKYKVDVQPIPADLDDALLSLEATTWYDRNEVEDYAAYQTKLANGEDTTDEDGNSLLMNTSQLRRIPGMVAEHVLAAGLGQFVTYDDDGEISGLMYERLGVALIPVVGRLRDRVVELELETMALRADHDKLRGEHDQLRADFDAVIARLAAAGIA